MFVDYTDSKPYNIKLQLILMYTFLLLIVNILKISLTNDNINIRKIRLHYRGVETNANSLKFIN